MRSEFGAERCQTLLLERLQVHLGQGDSYHERKLEELPLGRRGIQEY